MIYSRCSTEEQLKSGFSHEYQIDSIKRFMNTNDECNLIGEYKDTITGTKFDRPELLTLYNYCKANPGVVNFILVQKWDRFGRDIVECITWIRKFKKLGVEVNSPFERIDFSTTDYILFLSIRFGLAETESLKISDRTKDGINSAQRLGFYTGTAPFGYTRKESNDKTNSGKRRRVLTPDENAPLVKEIYNRFIAGEDRGGLARGPAGGGGPEGAGELREERVAGGGRPPVRLSAGGRQPVR